MTASDLAAAPGRRRHRTRFFLIASALMTLVVFAGFLPSFYARSRFRDTPLPAYLIVHGVVMTAWQLLFLVQNLLIELRRTDLHRRLGWIGAAIAVAVVGVGLHATISQPAALKARGIELPFPVAGLVVGNIFGFVLFAALVATAILRRRDAATHKRLIYWACVVTMGPAVTPMRTLGDMIMPFMPQTFPPEIAIVWVAWIALLAHDWLTVRRFHPVTILGGLLILFLVPALLDWTLLLDSVGNWVDALG